MPKARRLGNDGGLNKPVESCQARERKEARGAGLEFAVASESHYLFGAQQGVVHIHPCAKYQG